MNHTNNEEIIQLPNNTEAQLLRIIQESMTNVRRHANASRVTVTLVDEPPIFRVEVQDNGQGFDPANISPEKLGLRIMHERIASIGGKINIETVPGTGTKLILEVSR